MQILGEVIEQLIDNKISADESKDIVAEAANEQIWDDPNFVIRERYPEEIQLQIIYDELTQLAKEPVSIKIARAEAKLINKAFAIEKQELKRLRQAMKDWKPGDPAIEMRNFYINE